MKEGLKRVIDLANRLKEAVEGCDCVIYVSIDGTNPDAKECGVQLYRPERCGAAGLHRYRTDEDGTAWLETGRYGIRLYGARHEEGEK